MPSDRVCETAYAKINLTLHVTGRRADVLHELDSLVVFADYGDEVCVRPGSELTLAIDGPFGTLLSNTENLVLDAANLMGFTGEIRLTKNLPIASGMGGGSTDAAAAIRAITRATGSPLPSTEELLQLGADVPVCIDPRPVVMRGVGEDIEPAGSIPDLWLLLVNPLKMVPTGQVFSSLESRDNPPMSPLQQARGQFLNWLVKQRNDLTGAAIATCPQIADMLSEISATAGCQLARMSGSGATCFGLFNNRSAAERAANAIRSEHPDWWARSTAILAG